MQIYAVSITIRIVVSWLPFALYSVDFSQYQGFGYLFYFKYEFKCSK